MTARYVVDASYLVELLQVPGCFDPPFARAVKERFSRAVAVGARFYVPVTVVFEVANHIVHVDNGDERRRLAISLRELLVSSLEGSGLWVIPEPGAFPKELLALLEVYATELAQQGIGLTDAAVRAEAVKLKGAWSQLAVHIWTKDKRLKGLEPDAEDDPLVLESDL